MKTSLLIIDDDKQFSDELKFLLSKEHKCYSALNSKTALNLISEIHPDTILLDLMLGNESGIEILKKIKQLSDEIPVIMITEYASVDTAVEAMQFGAENYISKTPNLSELNLLIKRALQNKMSKLKENSLKEELQKEYGNIIGTSSAIKDVLNKAKLMAKNNNTVLITGESGTGKELIARQIHSQSSRAKDIFLAVNCAAIPDNLIESELFGHEQGAFTGALKKKLGKFEIASSGTIFLDEVGDLKPESQVKLMRVLQEREFERVGGNFKITTEARVIAATNRNLKEMVESGDFRQDLYFRLDVLPIHLPPLRGRMEDLPALINYFAKKISIELKIKSPKFSEESVKCFMRYNWPGNIRELINFITRALILSEGEEITPDILSQPLINIQSNINKNNSVPLKWDEMNELRRKAADEASRNIEKQFAGKLLKKFNGNVSKAAEFSGIDRTNLYRIINRTGTKELLSVK